MLHYLVTTPIIHIIHTIRIIMGTNTPTKLRFLLEELKLPVRNYNRDHHMDLLHLVRECHMYPCCSTTSVPHSMK